MNSRSPMLDMYRELTAQVVETVNAALPRAAYPGDDSPGATKNASLPAKKAATAWRPVPRDLETIDAELTSLSRRFLAIASDSDLTNAAKVRRAGDVSESVKATIEGLCAKVLKASHSALSILRDAAYPPRPTPTDAAQEAALAGIKGDLRMVLDPVQSDGLPKRMSQLLTRSLADNEPLTTWLLASSRWPEDYLVARGYAEDELAIWSELAARELDANATDGLAVARRTYSAVSNPQSGIPVLEVLLNGTIRTVIEDAAEVAVPLLRSNPAADLVLADELQAAAQVR